MKTVVKLSLKSCSLGDAAIIVVCFLAVGLGTGYFAGHYIAVSTGKCEQVTVNQ